MVMVVLGGKGWLGWFGQTGVDPVLLLKDWAWIGPGEIRVGCWTGMDWVFILGLII